MVAHWLLHLTTNLEGSEVKSLDYQDTVAGPLSKALNYSIVKIRYIALDKDVCHIL